MEDLIKEVKDFVKSTTSKGTKIILLSVTGSRGKDMNSVETSDYDCKVVVLYPLRDYILQNVKPVRRFETIFHKESQELEVSIISLLQVNQWCLHSNQAAYDILFTPIQPIKVQRIRH